MNELNPSDTASESWIEMQIVSITPRALKRTAVIAALANETTELPCLYITNNAQLAAINMTTRMVAAWLDELENRGWGTARLDPLPFTIPSAGWTGLKVIISIARTVAAAATLRCSTPLARL